MLIAQSLAKTKEQDLPLEFNEWVTFYNNYKAENPGKFYMALAYGKNVQGMKPGQWMTGADYKKLFDENGDLPKELRSAINKYSERVQDEMAERSSKVSRLAEHLYSLK